MGKLIALVTGGNGGIGLAAANQFVERGAYVFVTGRRERLEKMQPACRGTYRTLPISIASLLKSSRKRGD